MFGILGIKTNKHIEPDSSGISEYRRKEKNHHKGIATQYGPVAPVENQPEKEDKGNGKANCYSIADIHSSPPESYFGQVGLSANRTSIRHFIDPRRIVRIFSYKHIALMAFGAFEVEYRIKDGIVIHGTKLNIQQYVGPCQGGINIG
jgi:hypothetical protein